MISFISPKHKKICETFGSWNFTDFSDNDGNISVLQQFNNSVTAILI